MFKLLNTKELRQDTKDALSGITWFVALVPLAMAAHFGARYYGMIEYTIMGWFLATLGAVQLGIALSRGGKRIFRIPIALNLPKFGKISRNTVKA